MNLGKYLMAGLILVGAGVGAETHSRPNFLFVIMDDFGGGQFPPVAQMLTEESFDPELVRYVADQKGFRVYESSQALEAARKAMPTMSRLTRDGLFFTQAFAGAALCAPSRCGIMSGIHPNRLGIYNNVDVTELPGAMTPGHFLAPRFQQAGYATAHIGKWHIGPLDDALAAPILKKHGLAPDTYLHSITKDSPAGRELVESGFFGSIIPPLHPNKNGFDYYYGYNFHQSNFYGDYNVWENQVHAGRQEGYNTETFTDKALGFIDSAAKDGKPFFLSLNVHAVHGPLFPEPPVRYMKPFSGLPHILENFYGHVYAVDEGIRRITEALAAKGLLENTCIIFTSDNGAAVSRDNTLPGNAPHRGQKGQYTQGGIRVPLVIHWPARISKGRNTVELASHLDLLPTAMDAAGIVAPEGLDGKSLLPLINGAEKGPHDALVWFGLHSISWGFEDQRSLVGEGVRNNEPGAWVVRSRDSLLRYTGTLQSGLYRDVPEGEAPKYELYKTKNDPGETENVFEQNPETAAQLKQIAARRVEEIVPPKHWRRTAWAELVNSLK